MSLTSVEKAILINANEDYVSLFEVAQEAKKVAARAEEQMTAEQAVAQLISDGFVYVGEVEQTDGEIRETRRLDTADALEIVRDHAPWSAEHRQSGRFFALRATPKGQSAFQELLKTPLDKSLQ